jgi:hypothetical protein
MSRLFRDAIQSLEDYFNGFDERAGGSRAEPKPDNEGGDASSAVCFVALLGAMSYVVAGSSASLAAPF